MTSLEAELRAAIDRNENIEQGGSAAVPYWSRP